VPRRRWLDSKIDVFPEELAASGMHLDRRREGELITGQVRAVATLMNVTEATARTYLGDEIITGMARRMLFEVVGERPGADLMEALRTVPLPLALVGITVAALAKAMQVRAANEPPGRLRDVIAPPTPPPPRCTSRKNTSAGPGGAGCSSTRAGRRWLLLPCAARSLTRQFTSGPRESYRESGPPGARVLAAGVRLS
jgi:hypothetical protein